MTKLDKAGFEAVESGVLRIIDISDSECPTEYYLGEWHTIDKVLP